jgi:hypothetical protein
MLRQRINVCFWKAAPQRAGATQTVILGHSYDFAKVTNCAKLPLMQMASNGSSQPKAAMAVLYIGRKAGLRGGREVSVQLKKKQT